MLAGCHCCSQPLTMPQRAPVGRTAARDIYVLVCKLARKLCATAAGGGCRGAQGCRDQGSCQAAPHTAALTSAGDQRQGTPRGSTLPRCVCSTALGTHIVGPCAQQHAQSDIRLCTAPGIGWSSTVPTVFTFGCLCTAPGPGLLGLYHCSALSQNPGQCHRVTGHSRSDVACGGKLEPKLESTLKCCQKFKTSQA